MCRPDQRAWRTKRAWVSPLHPKRCMRILRTLGAILFLTTSASVVLAQEAQPAPSTTPRGNPDRGGDMDQNASPPQRDVSKVGLLGLLGLVGLAGLRRRNEVHTTTGESFRRPSPTT